MITTIEDQRREALQRAQSGVFNANCAYIIEQFASRGIPLDDILPRMNVLTYRAWQAKGRQVKRGEHGVKITTYIPYEKTEKSEDGREKKIHAKRPKSATVFHVSQTIPMSEGDQP